MQKHLIYQNNMKSKVENGEVKPSHDKTVEKKIILDLCGGTGSWSKPYKDAGYDVRVITLPEYNILEYIPPEGVYGILAAPPCTMFSFARTNAKTPRDLSQGMELVRACLEIIWKTQTEGVLLKFWALENPFGYLRRFLGKPILEMQPYHYGDPYKKRTDIWGFFNMPKRNEVERDRTGDSKNGEDWHHNGKRRPKGMDRQSFRSMTPEGFARAFFKANQ